MPAFGGDPNRRTVPRWRSWRATAQLGNLASVSARTRAIDLDLYNLRKARRDWDAHHTLAFAADFIGAAFVRGEFEAAGDAAHFVLDSSSPRAKAARQLAMSLLAGPSRSLQTSLDTGESTSGHYREIHDLREVLIRSPRNPVAW